MQSRGMADIGVAGLSDITRQLCLELGIKQPDSLVAAVRKLKRAVEAIPAMETFIQRVADVITAWQTERQVAGLGLSSALAADPPAGLHAWTPDVLDKCVTELQSWTRTLRERANGQVCPCCALVASLWLGVMKLLDLTTVTTKCANSTSAAARESLR